MKKIIGTLSVIIVLVFAQACKKDECGDCFTPPAPFMFEIVDKTTGENLFTNGTFQPAAIKVTNTENNENIAFSFLDEDSINVVVINTIGWKTEKVNLRFEISNQLIFSMYVDAERLFENCCSFTRYNEIVISGTAYEADPTTEIYRILYEN